MSLGKRAKPGDPLGSQTITARRINAWDDAAQAYSSTGAIDAGLGAPSPFSVSVINDSEDIIEAFEAVELLEMSMSPGPAPGLVAFRVDRPEFPEIARKIAITQEPIGVGKVGRALIGGISPIIRLEIDLEDAPRAVLTAEGGAKTSEDGPLIVLGTQDALEGDQPAPGLVMIAQDFKAPPRILAQLSGGTTIGPNQWAYSFTVVKPAPNNTFEPVLNNSDQPLTSLALGLAVNTFETNNSASGVQGNGVSQSNLDDIDFNIVDFGAAIVELRGPYPGAIGDSSVEQYWIFEAPNLVDGACDG